MVIKEEHPVALGELPQGVMHPVKKNHLTNQERQAG